MIKVAIVENELEQIAITSSMIERYSKEYSEVFSIDSFTNGYDFLESNVDAYQIIFMDIDMPNINGMDMARKLREKSNDSVLIFVTNLPQYAIDAYKVSALDFLLKPVTYADFTLAMRRAIASIKKNETSSFVLNIHGALMIFKCEDIVYIEMVKHDVNIHLSDLTSQTFRSSLNKVEPLLDKNIFFKCNSGCIVNINKIKMLQGDVLLLENGDRVSISRSRKKETIAKLNEFYGLGASKDE